MASQVPIKILVMQMNYQHFKFIGMTKGREGEHIRLHNGMVDLV